MADVLRLVRFPNRDPSYKAIVLLDLADGVNYFPTRDTLQINAAGKLPSMSSRGRRYGGERQVGSLHNNAGIYREILIKGVASADEALLAVQRVIRTSEDHDGKFLEWRPDGASRSVYFELRAETTYSVKYGWHQFAQTRSLTVLFQFPTSPLAHGDSMDLTEDWSQDSVGAGDYTFDAGAAADVSVVAGPPARLSAVANLAAEKRLVHTGRGHYLPDHQEVRQFTVGATLSGFKLGAVLKRVDASNYVECYVSDNGTASVLNVDTVVAGVRTNRASVALTRLAANTPYWLLARAEGNLMTAQLFAGSGPPPSPFNTAAAQIGTTASYQLSSSEGALGVGASGRAGTSWVPQNAGASVSLVTSRPYTYWGGTASSPEVFPLRGIPGDAPALVDAEIGAQNPAFPVSALIGWATRATAYNRVWNGDLEANAAGWSTGTVPSIITLAPTSVLRGSVAGIAKYGVGYLEMVTPAAAGSGTAFAIYRRFKQGTVYYASAWVRLASGAANSIVLGLDAGAFGFSGTPVALTASWQQVTLSWTPTQSGDVGYVTLSANTPGVSTIQIDGVVVSETNMAVGSGAAPSPQVQGKGAVPPYGVVKAESHDQADISGWTLQADGTYLGGYGIKAATSGAGSGLASFFLDPSLMAADLFLRGELHVEVWARVEVAAALAAPRLTLSLLSEAGAGFGGERFTAEYGSVGKPLNTPSSGSALARPYRLGTLRLPTLNPGLRWKLRLAGAWGAGSSGNFGVDYMVLVPARQRAVSPSAKANDATYPRFMGSAAESVKTVLSDLRGRLAKVPLPAGDDAGLGGTPLEMGGVSQAGAAAAALGVDVDVIMALWPLVPDDPTADATTMAASLAATFHAAVVPRYYLARGN